MPLQREPTCGPAEDFAKIQALVQWILGPETLNFSRGLSGDGATGPSTTG